MGDDLMLELVKTELDHLKGRVRITSQPPANSQSWVLDGLPRTLNQGKLLHEAYNDDVNQARVSR